MLIVVEGIDGSGKTAAVEMASAYLLQEYDTDALVTSELGLSNPWGAELRGRLMMAEDAAEEYQHIISARLTHYEHVVRPSLAAGRVVLQDRYVHSTLAYQGQSSLVTPRMILDDHEKAYEFPYPDVLIFMSVSLSTAEKRVKARGKQDAFDNRGRDFFAKAHEIFINNVNILQRMGKHVIVIDAEKDLQTVELNLKLGLDDVFGRLAA